MTDPAAVWLLIVAMALLLIVLVVLTVTLAHHVEVHRILRDKFPRRES